MVFTVIIIHAQNCNWIIDMILCESNAHFIKKEKLKMKPTWTDGFLMLTMILPTTFINGKLSLFSSFICGNALVMAKLCKQQRSKLFHYNKHCITFASIELWLLFLLLCKSYGSFFLSLSFCTVRMLCWKVPFFFLAQSTITLCDS